MKQFRFLTCLDLSLTKVTDDGIAGHLSGERGLHQLASLWLDDTQVTGAFRLYVPCLSLAGTQVNAANLKHIDAFILNLARTPIGDDAVPHLVERYWLNLNGTQITDDGLRSLASSTHLRSISVEKTAVSELAIADFKTKVPECRISKSESTEAIPETNLENLEFYDALISPAFFRAMASQIKCLASSPDVVIESVNVGMYHFGAFEVAVNRERDVVVFVRLRPVGI